MIEAQEILYIVLAFCALWITVFFCFFVYQIASTIKVIKQTVRIIEEKIDRVHGTFETIGKRFTSGMSDMGVIAKTIQEAVKAFKSRGE
jgi:uncharacterized protein YoxC